LVGSALTIRFPLFDSRISIFDTMKVTHTILDLSTHLFWDVDLNAMDFEKSKEQIIYKVLEYGLLNDWNIIKEVYGLETIKNVALELRNLDVVTLAYSKLKKPILDVTNSNS
jgi:hypothetical protein